MSGTTWSIIVSWLLPMLYIHSWMAPISYIMCYISTLPKLWQQLHFMSNNNIYLWPVASVSKSVFHNNFPNSCFDSSSSYCQDTLCRAQDAHHILSPLSLPAPPPAAIHRDEKIREGQRPQRSKTQAHTRQVWIWTWLLFVHTIFHLP